MQLHFFPTVEQKQTLWWRKEEINFLWYFAIVAIQGLFAVKHVALHDAYQQAKIMWQIAFRQDLVEETDTLSLCVSYDED